METSGALVRFQVCAHPRRRASTMGRGVARDSRRRGQGSAEDAPSTRPIERRGRVSGAQRAGFPSLRRIRPEPFLAGAIGTQTLPLAERIAEKRGKAKTAFGPNRDFAVPGADVPHCRGATRERALGQPAPSASVSLSNGSLLPSGLGAPCARFHHPDQDSQ
jgi:hypothetical protein